MTTQPPLNMTWVKRAYHWATAALLVALIVSGLLMLVKLDTWFWDRIPGILSDHSWGVVYTIHGATALALIMMFILHLYFSFLPEHRPTSRIYVERR